MTSRRGPDPKGPVYRYLLDTNVVVVFQKAAHLRALVAAASTISMAMVDDVYDELTVPKPGRPTRAEMSDAARIESNLVPPLWWAGWIEGSALPAGP